MASAVLALAAILVLAGPAQARILLRPPPGKVFFGVSDSGDAIDFRQFTNAVGKHPAVTQTFHPWGNSLHRAIPRWYGYKARPMLHISAADDETLEEIIAPRGIALGKDDDYLLRLNHSFASRRIRAYVRPLGEPNRCLNTWAAFDCVGGSRGSARSPRWYKRAFRRMYILLHGGASRRKINARLRRLGLPPMQRDAGDGREPRRLPRAPISVVWSPLPGGSPAIPVMRPGHYYPGDAWVDWVGTDFYAKYPYWKTLNRFYRTFDGKPFALTEWGVDAGDDPRFVRRIFGWTRKHKRTRMLIYYQDFAEPNDYTITQYPRSRRVIYRHLKKRRYPALPPHPPKPPPSTGGSG